MDKALPDKWIRKALFDLIDPLYPIYDTRVTGVDQPNEYILMTTQTADVSKVNKCEYQWDSTILLDFVTIYPRGGNTGSRLAVDDMVDDVRQEISDNGIVLDNGLTVIWYNLSFPNDITTVTQNEVVNRKFIRIELKIN
jgi:hypothetical protein